jgi:hypothetical protein
MNKFKQHNITSTLKKKGSVIVSFFEIALKNNIFRLSLGCIVAAIAVYVIYRLRHVIGRALNAALNAFATWLNSLNLSVADFAVIISVVIFFAVICFLCAPTIIRFFRQTARRACILSRAPLSAEEMRQIGATTQLEYCLAMACYLLDKGIISFIEPNSERMAACNNPFMVCYLLDKGIISFIELNNERTAACNNPLLHTEQWYYHVAIDEFKDDGPVSPAVRQWCINVMREHGILDSFLCAYKKARYENAKYIHSLLFPKN